MRCPRKLCHSTGAGLPAMKQWSAPVGHVGADPNAGAEDANKGSDQELQSKSKWLAGRVANPGANDGRRGKHRRLSWKSHPSDSTY